jgi:acyl carrier protein
MLRSDHVSRDDGHAFEAFVWGARVRRVLSETLGVSAEDLADGVSLTDDLAADSLDLLQVVLALEEDLAMTIDERRLAAVRTVGDLVTTVRTLTATGTVPRSVPRRAAMAVTAAAAMIPALGVEPRELPYRATVRGGTAGEPATLFRTGTLTPYSTEAIVDDALRAGDGAILEIALPGGTSDAEMAFIREHFEWLLTRGIRVTIGRDYRAAGWSGGLTSIPPA